MTTNQPLEDASTTERLVLLALLEECRQADGPAQTHDVRRSCLSIAEELDGEVVGHVSEAVVIRALYELESEGVIDEHRPDDRSPVGKGRPAYELAVEEERVLELVGEDSPLADIVPG